MLGNSIFLSLFFDLDFVVWLSYQEVYTYFPGNWKCLALSISSVWEQGLFFFPLTVLWPRFCDIYVLRPVNVQFIFRQMDMFCHIDVFVGEQGTCLFLQHFGVAGEKDTDYQGGEKERERVGERDADRLIEKIKGKRESWRERYRLTEKGKRRESWRKRERMFVSLCVRV